jgi:thiamine biosynthesis lipoprotein
MAHARKTSRRHFLSGASAVEALGDWTHGAAPPSPPPRLNPKAATTPTYLVHFSRQAMACEFQIYLPANHAELAPDAALEALELIDRLEDQLSVYREHSEVSQINRRAADGAVAIETRLFELLKYSVELFHDTDGAFDITAGPLSRVWGFYRRQGRMPEDDALREALADVGSQHVLLDADQHTVCFARSGVEINLGSIGKGYAVDRAAALLEARGVHDFLFHGGKSSVLARGSRIPLAAEANPWSVGVGHPLRPEQRLGVLTLRNQAMGTSGAATQSFHHAGKRYGHVLDPRSGWPAEGVLSVSVVADDAATADALSTALYVLGPEKAEAFCARHAEITAIMSVAGPGNSLEVLELNVSDDIWRPDV